MQNSTLRLPPHQSYLPRSAPGCCDLQEKATSRHDDSVNADRAPSPAYILPHLREGAESSGRTSPLLRLGVGKNLRITDDTAASRRALAREISAHFFWSIPSSVAASMHEGLDDPSDLHSISGHEAEGSGWSGRLWWKLGATDLRRRGSARPTMCRAQQPTRH